jgi:hypothetical protein
LVAAGGHFPWSPPPLLPGPVIWLKRIMQDEASSTFSIE